jgi:hypothetical protein
MRILSVFSIGVPKFTGDRFQYRITRTEKVAVLEIERFCLRAAKATNGWNTPAHSFFALPDIELEQPLPLRFSW